MDRRKKGSKHHLAVDAAGTPLAAEVTAASGAVASNSPSASCARTAARNAGASIDSVTCRCQPSQERTS